MIDVREGWDDVRNTLGQSDLSCLCYPNSHFIVLKTVNNQRRADMVDLCSLGR